MTERCNAASKEPEASGTAWYMSLLKKGGKEGTCPGEPYRRRTALSGKMIHPVRSRQELFSNG